MNSGVLPMEKNRRGAFRPLTPDEKRRIKEIYLMLGETHPDPVSGILTAMGLPIARKTVVNVLNKAGIFLRKKRPVAEPAPIRPVVEPSIDRKSQAAGEREEGELPGFVSVPAEEASRFEPREKFERMIEWLGLQDRFDNLRERAFLAVLTGLAANPALKSLSDDDLIDRAKSLSRRAADVLA